MRSYLRALLFVCGVATVMPELEPEKIKGQCDRCYGRDKQLQYLKLQSEVKSTTLNLCTECFNKARTLWLEFINEK